MADRATAKNGGEDLLVKRRQSAVPRPLYPQVERRFGVRLGVMS